jgi:hypothetical protein
MPASLPGDCYVVRRQECRLPSDADVARNLRLRPRLSTLFTDRKLAAIFAAAERDVPPEAIPVTNEPAPLLPSRGAAERVLA